MPVVIGKEIPEWDPKAVIEKLTAEGGYENELMMVYGVYRKKKHSLNKETALGILQGFNSGFIDVMLLSAAGLVSV